MKQAMKTSRFDQVDHFWLFFKATWRRSMLTSRNSDRHVFSFLQGS